MGWEPVPNRKEAPAGTVILHRGGRVVIPARLRSEIGSPQWVALFVDRERRVLGIRPLQSRNGKSYKVARQGVITCHKAIRRLGAVEESGYRPATLRDGVLEVALAAEVAA